MASDMRRREFAVAKLNPQGAFDIAGVIDGGSVAYLGASRVVGFEQD